MRPADLDTNKMVGFSDLTTLLSNWRPCPACPEDLNGDGLLAFADRR